MNGVYAPRVVAVIADRAQDGEEFDCRQRAAWLADAQDHCLTLLTGYPRVKAIAAAREEHRTRQENKFPSGLTSEGIMAGGRLSGPARRLDIISTTPIIVGMADEPAEEPPQEDADEAILELPPAEEVADQMIAMPTFHTGPAPGERQRNDPRASAAAKQAAAGGPPY